MDNSLASLGELTAKVGELIKIQAIRFDQMSAIILVSRSTVAPSQRESSHRRELDPQS